jgi:hypothetical protein
MLGLTKILSQKNVSIETVDPVSDAEKQILPNLEKEVPKGQNELNATY